MSMVATRNIGALVQTGGESLTGSVAGGAASGNIDGATVDRLPTGAATRMDSAVVAGALIGTSLAASQTGTLTTIIQDSPDGSTWSTFATLADVVVTGGGVESDSVDLDVNLLGAERYVRTRQTLTTSAGAGSSSAGCCLVLNDNVSPA